MSAGMAMEHDHAGHLASDPGAEPADDHGCNCGCECGDSGCAPQGAGFLAPGGLKTELLRVGGSRSFTGAPAQPAAAYHLDLLRPPSRI